MIPDTLRKNFEPELLELLDREASMVELDKGHVMLDQGAFITHILIVLEAPLK